MCDTRDSLLDPEICNTLLRHKNACRYWEDRVIISTQSVVVQVNYQPAPLDRLLCYVYGQGMTWLEQSTERVGVTYRQSFD
jgi:hypothetical protein